MSIFKTPYETAACGGHILDDVREKVKEAIHMGQIQKNEEGIYEIATSQSFSNQIPAFFHPLMVDLGDGDGEAIAIDVRAYYRTSGPMGSAHVVDQAGYSLMLMRAQLTKIFNSDFRSSLLGFSVVPVSVYSSMIADGISRRLNIQAQDYHMVRVMACIYYYSLFEDKVSTKSPAFIEKVTIQIHRATGIPARDIRDVAEKNSVELTDIESFCMALKMLINNVRIRDLNFVTLATMLNGQWFGPQGREMINVALEHPPTLQALIYQAYIDRSFKRTGLAQLLDNSFFKKQSQQYIGAINNMIR